MDNIVNRKKTPWVRPWHIQKFDDLYNRDERFFAIVMKGVISWLNRNIVMYNKPINHFIFNTGSSYMYVESNGYEMSFNETTGEDWMYMQMPRCVLELQSINIPTDELSSPYARGNYERRDGNNIRGFNSEIRRLPIEMSIDLKYVFSNFNESIVVLQELIEKIVFQKYFNITYLGQIIKCSIEFPQDFNIEVNKIDMTATDVNQKNLNINIKVCTNYPVINERAEVPSDNIISAFGGTIINSENNEDLSQYNIGDNSGVIDTTLLDDNNDNHDPSEISITIGDTNINLQDFDLDHDGNISDDELYFLGDLIINLDINKDGKIDKDDILAIIEMYYNEKYNIDLDINKDGKIDKDDILDIIHYISILDTNDDGVVDNDDINNLHDMIDNYINYLNKFDLNNDLVIDDKDLQILIDAVNSGEYDERYDLNDDGILDQKDIDLLISIINQYANKPVIKTYYNQIILYLNKGLNKKEAISDIHKYLYN